MLKKQIKEGETYLFATTDNPKRTEFIGEAFTVTQIKAVFRHTRKGVRKTYRFFNVDGVGARAEELEPLPEREFPCNECFLGEMISGPTQPSGRVNYECDKCGATASFP